MTSAELFELPGGADRRAAASPPLPVLDSVSEMVQLQRRRGEMFLRVSNGPDLDVRTGARHPESGYALPGLPAWTMQPEPWWPAGATVWVARQLVRHSYLLGESNRAWLLTGQVAGRGADGEPLVAGATPVAVVGPGAFLEAESIYAAWRCRDFR
ncbi:DUF6098 family protein [Georgenia subflava]|uniref:Uncharacterized protein n=1 Tax=Georgenia subflava TaxID=1622177 RepID=A0A6N7ELU1_9MICO|nr:DUF6098 family protein [Georgenia subflava]MPV37505.1 hypothetical protein [Georgenia subflava]